MRTLEQQLTGFIILCLTMATILFWCSRGDAQAQPKQDDLHLRLVQCLRAECDECLFGDRDPRESVAILWVLKKQASIKQISLLRETMDYCAMFDRNNKRAVAIWLSTFDEPKHATTKRGRQWWLKMRKWIHDVVSEEEEILFPDPHPDADHFGGGMDLERAKRNGWRLVAKYCNLKNGKWCNYFWSTQRK